MEISQKSYSKLPPKDTRIQGGIRTQGKVFGRSPKNLQHKFQNMNKKHKVFNGFWKNKIIFFVENICFSMVFEQQKNRITFFFQKQRTKPYQKTWFLEKKKFLIPYRDFFLAFGGIRTHGLVQTNHTHCISTYKIG